MGNKQTKYGNSKSAIPADATNSSGDYGYEETGTSTSRTKPNLYTETRDMVAISFLMYAFGYALDVSRKIDGGLKGISTSTTGQEEKNHRMSSSVSNPSTFNLHRSFTPSEILRILEMNRTVLAKYYPGTFGGDGIEGSSGSTNSMSNSKKKKKSTQYEMIVENLQTMQQRVDQTKRDHQQLSTNKASNYRSSTSNTTTPSYPYRPITIEEYDDKHQKHELVYGIIKDDIAQRITLVFRGTDSSLAFKSNWTTNISLLKTNFAGHKHDKKDKSSSKRDIRKSIKDVFGGVTNVRVHSGFYNYVFGLTKDPNDPKTYRKYDEILHDLNIMFQQYPNYKLYVTGHSLGAALSTLVAFSLASCNDTNHINIPKPITCINFASPRVGNKSFLKACQSLEQSNKLHILRIV